MRNKAAFPQTIWDCGEVINYRSDVCHGLSKREYFAALALQGLISNSNNTANLDAGNAVLLADELIKSLETK